MKSLEARLAALRRALDEANAQERVVKVLLLTVESREDVELLERYEAAHPTPPASPQRTRGRVRIEVLPPEAEEEFWRQVNQWSEGRSQT